MTLLRLLARQTRIPGAVENTKYGLGRASPKTFLTHYVATISSSIQSADAQSILDHAQSASAKIAFGLA